MRNLFFAIIVIYVISGIAINTTNNSRIIAKLAAESGLDLISFTKAHRSAL